MKPYTLVFALLILCTGSLFAQPSLENTEIEGIWKGFIITDQQVPYEIVISSNDGVYSGYSLTTFTVKGKKMIAVKKLKVEKQLGELIISDDDLIFDNFQNKGAKDFDQTNTLVLSKPGENLELNGKFVTRPTRQFRPMTGGIKLEKQPDSSAADISGKLKEMNLWASMSFLQPKPEPEYAIKKIPLTSVAKIDYPEPERTAVSVKRSRISNSIALNPVFKTEPVIIASVPVKTVPAQTKPSLPATTAAVTKPPVTTSPPPGSTSTAVVTKPPVKQPATRPAVTPAVVAKNNPPVTKPATTPPVVVKTTAPVTRPVTPTPPPVSAAYTRSLEKRQIETIQTINFKTDSLLVTLYDNGEVDGDTVSLILNGKMILARQGLTTNPINKTIYLTPDLGDSLQLIMYAENLGTLAPNTGLLIVYDGTDRYEIRFSGDLQKNAAINLRRRKL